MHLIRAAARRRLEAATICMTTLPEYFGAAYLINLPERTDRLKAVRREFSRVGWYIGPGGVEVFCGRKFTERATFPSPAVRGAFYSHWECLQRADAARQHRVLIFEDDIALAAALGFLTSSICARLDADDWDFVFFGHLETGATPNASSRIKPSDVEFKTWDRDIQGLHFYGVNGRILHRLNAHLQRVASGVEGDQETGPMPIDGALNTFRRINPDVRTLIATPKLGWQRPSRSDITPKRFDRIRAIRPLISAIRNVKRMASEWSS